MYHHRCDRMIRMTLLCTLMLPGLAAAQSTMPGVENTVGYLASGTSILPRTTSEAAPMIHGTIGNWTAMLHAGGFAVDIQQNGPRGRDKFFSTNWIMPMAHRQFGRQGITLRTMVSLEPFTVTQRRYPLLFQTGESAYGLSITDGQHPHDLLMEVAGRYDFQLSERAQMFVYAGPVAAAALGPTAFPHRASASENPLAVIGHHQQDSTHIATNVITLGIVQGPVQLEASTFRGREPDENRWNFNRGKPDSFATRLTVAPHRTVSAQFSTGRINNPEELDPTLDTVRTTASIHHNLSFASGHVASSFMWGRNKALKNGARRIFNYYTFESTAKFRRRNWIWTRIENADRDRTLLPVQTVQQIPGCLLCGVVGRGASLLDDDSKVIRLDHSILGPDGTPITIEEEPIGRIQAYTLGYEREVPIGVPWLNAGLGGQFTWYTLPPQLRSVYGDRPSTVVVFLRLRPTGNAADHMKQMHRR